MISKNSIIKSAISIAGAASLVIGFALPAAAETNLNLGANLDVKVNTGLSPIIERSDKAIDARIDSLNKLSARIDEMKRVSENEKASVRAEVASENGLLNSLRAKIHADGDVATARSDEKTITADHRIYMLVIPQGYILAASDRTSFIVEQMTNIQAKFQSRISAAAGAGKDVTVLNAKMSDMSAKMQAALAASASAKAKVANLSPDKGDTAVAASNKAALVSARADLKTSKDDLAAAHADMNAIIEGLKALK